MPLVIMDGRGLGRAVGEAMCEKAWVGARVEALGSLVTVGIGYSQLISSL